MVPDLMAGGVLAGSPTRVALFENDGVARTRSGFGDFAIFIKIIFYENGVLASTASKSHFRDSEAHDCDWGESIVFYHMKSTLHYFSARFVFAERRLWRTGEAHFRMFSTHDVAVARGTSQVGPGICALAFVK